MVETETQGERWWFDQSVHVSYPVGPGPGLPSTWLCTLGDGPSLHGHVLAPRDLGEASFSLDLPELRVNVVEAVCQQFSGLE